MVAEKINYYYDGSFEGFLSTIFAIYERRLPVANICSKANPITDIFSSKLEIDSHAAYANRVMKGLLNKAGKKVASNLYRCFLSEINGVEMRIYKVMREIFNGNRKHFSDFRDENVMELHKIIKMIRREVHRMHAFVRFQELKDGSFAAVVEPDFNVMPIIGYHFEARYPAMEWLIFDAKRQYGIHYKDYSTQFVSFEERIEAIKDSSLSEDEVAYQAMWKKYFNSVNISERNNEKLHLRHVPKRYWKNLIEKQ